MAANYTVTYTINAVGNLKEQSKFAEKLRKDLEAASTVGSKAAGRALDQSKSKLSEFTDYRRSRGIMESTGASARDFSRESQGLGGLARTYATFGANIFAATLAFQQFKKAFEFEQLQRASEVFAVTIGKNIGGVAKDLASLSEGALTAKAAQQIANYGSSAGLTADQLRRLVVVARGASNALGRDLGDSIDRLIRGVGKLEPELLDELGILTRTQTAGEKYAASIGKTFQQLTQFEKVQAFTNAVLEEGERKFAAVSKAVDVSPFEKFSAALANAATKMLNLVNTALVPLLDFFAKNPTAMIVALGAAFVKLATMAVPALKNIGDASYENAEKVKQNLLKIANPAGDLVSAQIESQKEAIKKNWANLQRINDGEAEILKKKIATKKQEIVSLASKGYQFPGMQTYFKQLYAELDKLEEERQRTIQNRLAQRARRNAALAETVEPPASRSSLINTGRAMAEVVKQEGLINAQLVAQQYGLREGFKQLNTETQKFIDNRKEVMSGLEKGHSVFARFETIQRSVAAGTMYLSGAFKIATAAVAGFISTIGVWLGVIGLVVGALSLVVSATGGFNEKIGELEDAQSTMNKNLQNSASYIKEYQDKVVEASKGTTSLLDSVSYSSNVFTGLIDNLDKSTKAFQEYANSTGYATAALEGLKSAFGGGVVNEQIKGLKDTIITALSTTNEADKEKVTKAVLSALPEAKDINDALSKISGVTDKGMLSTISDRLTTNLKKITPEIQNQASAIKTTEEAWKSLGSEVDKYIDKTDKAAKDPKLEKTVDALDNIIANLSNAVTDQEKLNILSTINKDIIEKIAKLDDGRSPKLREFVKVLEESRALEELVSKQKAYQVEQEKLKNIELAKGLELQLKSANYESSKQFNNVRYTAASAIELTGEDTVTTELENRKKLLTESYYATKKYYDELTTESIKQGKQLEAAGFKEMSAALDADYKNIFDRLSSLVERNMALVGTAGGKIFVSNFSASLVEIETAFQSAMSRLNVGQLKTYQSDLERENRKLLGQASKTDVGASNILGAQTQQLRQAAEEARAEQAAKKPLKPAGSTKIPKISMEYELQIKLLNAQIAANKILEDQERNILGYITQQTLANDYNLRVALEDANNKKEIAEINRRLQEDEKRKSAEAIANHSKSLDIQKLIHQTNLDRLKIDYERDRVLAASLANEKNILLVKSQILDIESSILDNLSDTELIPKRIADQAKSELELKKELLDIDKQRNLLGSKRLQISANEKDPIRATELTASVDREEAILNSKEQQFRIQSEINNLVAEYRGYISEIVKSEEVLSNSLDLQLDSYNYISSISERLLTVEKLKESIITSQAAKYIAFANTTEDADTKKVALLNTILETENKLLEVRQKSYELNAKSNEDIGNTIVEGVSLAVIEANKKVPGIAKAVVDGVTAGISDAVDYLFAKIKAREKVVIGDIINALGSGIKNVIFDAIASKLKASLLDLLQPDKQQQGIDGLKSAIEKEILSLDKHQSTIESAIRIQEQIVTELRRRNTTNALIANNNAKAGNESFDYIKTELKSPVAAFSGLGDSVSESTAGILEFANGLGKTDFYVQGLSDSFLSCSASSDELESSSFSAAVANAKLTNASINAANTLNALPNIISSVSGGTGNAVGGIVGTVTKGFDIISKGFSLFTGGKLGETIGTTIGSIVGPELVASISAAIPGIGWAVSAASLVYSLLKKPGGGPKEGGFGAVGATPTNQERYFTPDSKDKDILKIIKQQQTDLSSMLELVGGKLPGKSGFALGYDTDPKGTAPNRMQAGVYIDGQLIYESIKSDLGRDQERLNEEIATETKRGVLAALTASDLPENITNYFKDLTSEVISNLELAQVDTKLDMATILGSIAKNREEYATIFGEDIYNITEEVISGLSNGVEKLSDAFNILRDEFTWTNVLIRNVGLSAEQAFGALGLASTESRKNLITAAGGLDKFSTLVSFYTDNFTTDADRMLLAMSIANDTLNKGFAALNLTIPETIDEFNALMVGALDAKTGSAELTAELLRLAPAFAEIMAVNEKFTELFKMTNFKLSNPVLTAKNAVGNAARQAFITATGGLEKFTEKTAFYIGELFSAAEQHTRIFYSASDVLREGFSKLGTSIPATAAEFNNLVAAAMNMGEAGADLFGKLMDLAPAFDTVINSIDSTKSAIHEMTGSFISDIEDTIYTEQQRYEKYQALAQKQIDYLDSIERMTPEELKRSGVTETTIQEAGAAALAAIKSAWSNLQPEVQVSYGQDFIRTVSELDTSLSVLLDRLRPITNIEGVSSISDTGTINSTQNTEQDVANALDTVIQKNNSFWDGLARALNDVVDRFGIAAANMGTAADNMYIATTTPQNINVAVNLDSISREVG